MRNCLIVWNHAWVLKTVSYTIISAVLFIICQRLVYEHNKLITSILFKKSSDRFCLNEDLLTCGDNWSTTSSHSCPKSIQLKNVQLSLEESIRIEEGSSCVMKKNALRNFASNGNNRASQNAPIDPLVIMECINPTASLALNKHLQRASTNSINYRLPSLQDIYNKFIDIGQAHNLDTLSIDEQVLHTLLSHIEVIHGNKCSASKYPFI